MIALPARIESAEVVWHRSTLRLSVHGTSVFFYLTEADAREIEKNLGGLGSPENQRLAVGDFKAKLVRGGVTVQIFDMQPRFQPVKRSIWNQMLERETEAREAVYA